MRLVDSAEATETDLAENRVSVRDELAETR
jgi:hypothetical protein